MSILKPELLQTSDNWFNRNKTKLLGLAIITVNYLQLPANAEVVHKLVSETAFALINVALGLLALWFGFLNNPPAQPPASEGG